MYTSLIMNSLSTELPPHTLLCKQNIVITVDVVFIILLILCVCVCVCVCVSLCV